MCLSGATLSTAFPTDFPDMAPILVPAPDFDSNAWDAVIEPLLDIRPAVSTSSQKRPRPQQTSSCQCPCAAMHIAAAVAKQRKCCGGNCSCPPGECRCPQTAVPTSYRCCADPADLIADNVAAALSITSPIDNRPPPAQGSSCCGAPAQTQLDPLLRPQPPPQQTLLHDPSHHPQPVNGPCCGSASSPPHGQVFQAPVEHQAAHPLLHRHQSPPLVQQPQPQSVMAPPTSCCVLPARPHVAAYSQPIPTQLPSTAPALHLQSIVHPQASPPLVPLPHVQQSQQASVPRCGQCCQPIPANMQSLRTEDKTPSTVLAQLYPATALPSLKQPNGVHHPVPLNSPAVQTNADDHSRGSVLGECSVQAVADVPSTTSSPQGRVGQNGHSSVKRSGRSRSRGRGRGRGRGRAMSFPESKASSTMMLGPSSSVASMPASAEERSREFGCNKCPSTFFFKQNRDRHINEVHLGHRPHKCDFPGCESAFKNRSGLKQHARTVHEKARPFKCTLCNSAFGQRNHLTQHVLVVHDKVKMYKCDLCSMTFSNVGNRTQHMKRRHSGDSEQPKKNETVVHKLETAPASDT